MKTYFYMGSKAVQRSGTCLAWLALARVVGPNTERGHVALGRAGLDGFKAFVALVGVTSMTLDGIEAAITRRR